MTHFLSRRRAGPPVVIRRSTGTTGRFARLRFEELEPRILLSADLAPGLSLSPAQEVGVLPLGDSLHSHVERQVSQDDVACEAASIADLYVVQPGEDDALERAETLARATCGAPALVVELDATRDGFEQLAELTGSLAELERVTVVLPASPVGFAFGDATWQPAELASRIERVAAECGAVVDLVASGAVDAATIAGQRLELVFVDSRVPDADSLVADLLLQSDATVRYEVVAIDSGADGLAQVGAALQGRHDVAALHVISHGADGGILLGAGFIDAASLRGAAGSVGAWSAALAPDADILLYGCDVAGGERGREFAELLAGLTGADVASSDDATAADVLGGDWQLEYQVGEVQATVAVSKALQQAWSGRLALDAVGAEVAVNTQTNGAQSAAGSGPGAVAMDDAGNYVVVFEDADSNGGDVFFRRFDAAGNPLGAATRVNATLADRQYDARVAMAGNGSFVVTWTSNLQDGSGTGIYARRFAADGTAQGGEFRVNTTTTGDQANSTVAMASGGAFVVGWVSDDGSGSGIRGQRYDAAGVAQGGELLVNVTTTQVQSAPSATITDGGDFGFVWQGLQSGSYDVYLRGYSSAGAAGAETRVNQTTVGAQTSVVIGTDATGANVVIAWASDGQDPDGSQGIYARRFNGSGVAQGNEFRLNSSTSGTQSAPVVAVDSDGDFVVGWNDAALDGSGSSVWLQRFDSAGLRIGGAVRANTTTAGDQLVAGVAISGSHVAVAWQGNGSGDAAGVFTRAFIAVQYTTVTVSTTADTIDGSDTSSIAALLASRGTDGQVSLREAITAANNTTGPVRILFDVPGATVGGVHTITLDSLLPAIGKRVLIDGTTEPDHGSQPMIVLRAQTGITVESGLRLWGGSDGSEIRGLVFQGFSEGALSVGDSGDHTIAGNWFGLDATGNAAAANGWGITLWNSANNVIGGTTAADRNVISGNLSSGMTLESDDGSTTGNRIIGNYLGTNAAGTAAIGNGAQAIWAGWATGNSIGGTGAGEGNVISGTTSWVGIQLAASAANNTIQGNYIGLDAAGTSVLANAWGGIYAESSGNLIGGSAAGAANVISGSGGFGIALEGAGATGNVVTGNRIGTDATGTLARGNGGAGVVLSNGAANNRIGGTQAGEGNWIANGGGDGIELSAAGTGNALLGNLVWGNGGLAIDLLGGDGVTANDAGDADAGSNALQNYPVLVSATVAGGATTITGSINSTANTTLRLEFYSSPTADASGHGEAAAFLGATNVTTDAGGNASFSATLFGVGVTAGHAVSATATVSLGGGNYGSTSEFAANVVAAPLQAPVVGVPGAQSTPEDVAQVFSSATGNAITITDADAAGGTVEVTLSVTQGALTLAGTSGLSFVTGDGTADAVLVFRGTTTAVNAALDGLAFTTPAEFSGAATLTVTARDSMVVGLERDASLASRYTFEGSAADVAPGSAQDGALIGNAGYATVIGRGQVLSLDGNGDAVQIAGVVGTSNVTIGGWVNLSALSVGRTEFISLDDRVHIALDDYAGVKGSVQTGPGQWLDLSSGQFIAGTGWHHVMYVYDDASDAHALYIDGQLVAASSSTASIDWSGAATTWIGRHPTNTPGWDLEGQVDDVRIYGRALSAAEVATIASGPSLQDSDTVALTVTVANDAPVLGFASGSFTYPENAGAVLLAPAATVSDVDSPDFAGGSLVVTLTANGQAEDRLGIRNEGNGAGQVGISGTVVSYGGVAIGSFSGGGDGSTPLVVSFNANASVAAVQAVGRNITYQNVSDAPSTLTRTITGYVTDGDGGTSNLVSGTIAVQPSNDAPVVATTGSSLSYNENDGPRALDPGLTLADVDSATLTGATVRMSVAYAPGEDVLAFSAQSGITASWDAASGTLTLSGTATVAQYQAALRSITYTNTSENPSIAVRTASFTVSDGVATSAAATRQVQVVNWQDPPTTIDSGASAAEDSASIAVVLAGNDVDGSVASFSLTGLPANGKLYADAGRTQLVIAGTAYSATGNQRILYFVPDANWNGTTTFQYAATDNLGMADITPATVTITVTAVNDAPTFGGLDGAPAYTENGAAVKLDVDVTLADVELSAAGNYAGATLTLARSGGANPQDQLAFDGTVVTTNGANVFVSGAQVGTYTFTGGQLSVSFGSGATQARVDALLRNVVYWNSSDAPPASVVLDWTFSDGNAGSQGSGGALQATGTTTVTITAVDDTPVVAATASVLSYTENDGPRAVDAGLTVGDVDSAMLAGAAVSITTNYANGQDVLGFVDAGGITGSWDPATGTLTLSGAATVAQYQAALRSVTYANTSENPGTLARTVTFAVTDGTSTSAAAARQVQLAAVNDAPQLGHAGLPGPVDFTEQSPVGIAPAITVDDVDSAQLAGAVVTIVAGYEPGVDQLAFTDMLGITGSWNAATGTLTLSGNASLASYQTALRSIAFYNGSDAPSTTPRSVEIVVTDGAATSNVLSRTVTVTPVDDLPIAQAGGPYTIAEGGTLQLDASASVDPDGGSLTYAWDLDGDGVFGEAGEPLTVTPAVSWSTLHGAGIVDDGVYAINLRVTDSAGVSAYSKATLTVANAAPTLLVSGTGSASAGQSYTLNLAATDAGADTISSWTVNWGDGSIVTYAGNPASVTHTYASAGNFGVLVSATDEDGTHLQNSLLVPTWAGSDAVFRIAPGGAVLGQFGAASGLDDQAELVVGPDGNVYVTSMSTGTVKRFAPDGSFLGDFIGASSTLGMPGGLGFGPDGNLYVVSYDHASVLRYDGTTGALLGSFVTAGSGGLSQPLGIAFGPDGDLYVTSRGPDAIMRYDGTTGAFVGVFVAPGVNGPNSPEDIAFGPDGNLYVANLGDSTVRRYDGATGAWLGDFVTAGSGGLSGPAGLAFGPDGHLYVGSQNTDSIKRYDGATGAFLDDYVAPGAGGLDSPAYFNFLAQHRVSVAAAQPPVATPSGAIATFTENGSAVALDPALTVTDADNATLVGATLRIATNYASGQDTLAFVAQAGITGAWDATSGTLTLSGNASLAAYQQALRSITFATSGENPSTAARGIELALDDGIVAGPVATLAVNVAAVNDAPTTTPVTLAPLAEDGGARLITQAQLLANAADVDGGALVASNLQISAGAGTLVDNGDGTWRYTPAANDDTAATFSYSIVDGNGGSVAGSASLDLTPVNDAPTTTPVTLAPHAEDGGPRLITQAELLGNAADIDGGALIASNLQVSAGAGTLVDNGDGTWTYTPAANDASGATFSYAVSDGAGGSVAGSASLDLTPVNDAPTTTPVTLAPHAEDGGPRLITQADLLANATDVDGDALVASNLQISAGAGTLVDNGDGTWTYTPTANDASGLTFSYTISDGAGGSVAGSASLDLTPVNDAPTTTPVTLAPYAEDAGPRVITQADLLGNAADIDGGALVAGNLQLASGAGSLVDNGDGTWTYTPAANDDTAATFSYTISDGAGGSVAGSASLDLTPVNDAPTTTPVTLAPLAEDGGARLITQAELLGNATDIDGGALVASNLEVSTGAGTLVDNGDGSWTYTPAADDDGAATFSYTISDGAGGSTTGSASLDLIPVNDAPTTTPVTLAPLAEDGGPRLITQAELLAHATDVDGAALLATNLQLASGAGTLVDNGDGTWTYTPAANDDTAASFSFSVVDGAGGSVAASAALDLLPVNDAPTITSDGGGASATLQRSENSSTVTVSTASDVEADAIRYGIVGGADAARFQVDSTSGALVFIAAPDFEAPADADGDGVYEVLVQADDGHGGLATQALRIVVGDVNEAPAAVADALGAVADQPTMIATTALLANDTDIDGDSLQLVAVSAPGFGTVSQDPAGNWVYAPMAGFAGVDRFTYTVADAAGLKATAEVTVVVVAAGGTADAGGLLPPASPSPLAPANGPRPSTDTASSGTGAAATGAADGGGPAGSGAGAADDSSANPGDGGALVADATTSTPQDPATATAPGASEPAAAVAPLFDPDAIFGPPAGGRLPVAGGEGADASLTAFERDQQSAARERALETRQWAPATALAAKDGVDALLATGAQQALGLFRSLSLAATEDDLGHSLHVFRDLLDDIDAAANSANRQVAEVVVGSGLALSAGAVAWLLRAGALGASLLSVLPAWSTFDPIPVIRRRRARPAEEPVAPADLAAETALARVLRPGLRRANPDAS